MARTKLVEEGRVPAVARGVRRGSMLLAGAVALVAQAAEGQAPMAETLEVFTLGFRGDDVVFQSIQSVSISEDGKIMILDRVSGSDPAVTVVSLSGNVLARWGREGDGPGELEDGSQRAGFVAGDTVAIAGMGRAALYTWRGEELDRYGLAATDLPESLLALAERGENVGGAPRGQVAFVAGRITTWKYGMDLEKFGELVAAGSGDIDEVFSAMQYALGPWNGSETWATRPGPPVFDFSLSTRLSPTPVLAMIPSRRVVAGFGDEYLLAVISGESGDTIGQVARDVPVRRPTRSFIRSASSSDDVDEALESFGLIKNVFWGPPGALWVERDLGIDDEFSEPLECWKECKTWDIFGMAANNGTFLGAVSLPKDFSPMAGNDSLLAGVVVDEMDQSGIRVLRVSLPGVDMGKQR